MAKPGHADRIQLLVPSASRTGHDDEWEQQNRNAKPERDRWWLHIALLCLTLLSTTVFGYSLAKSFHLGRGLDDEFITSGYELLFKLDPRLLQGCAYAVPLILILLAHELGHYITCRRWNVSATLPYFAPSPTLLGTLGAFIRVRSPIYQRRALFDIGISGPIAGFAVALPVLITGIGMSKACLAGAASNSVVFGTPLLFRLLEWLRFAGVPASHLCLHPAAMAAWAGLLATAINLLPVGQLDGGHIVYALFGRQVHAVFSWIVIAGLLVSGFYFYSWWVWAVAMFFFRRHPLIVDEKPIGTKRRLLACGALLIFILSFSLVPISGG